jgi:hypothetical protein
MGLGARPGQASPCTHPRCHPARRRRHHRPAALLPARTATATFCALDGPCDPYAHKSSTDGRRLPADGTSDPQARPDPHGHDGPCARRSPAALNARTQETAPPPTHTPDHDHTHDCASRRRGPAHRPSPPGAPNRSIEPGTHPKRPSHPARHLPKPPPPQRGGTRPRPGAPEGGTRREPSPPKAAPTTAAPAQQTGGERERRPNEPCAARGRGRR